MTDTKCTTRTSETATPDLQPCPSWCTLTTGHGWDSIHDDGALSRGHAGPTFGRFLFGGSTEHDSGRVEIEVEIYTDPQYDARELTGADLLDLAADAVAAAEWLESVR